MGVARGPANLQPRALGRAMQRLGKAATIDKYRLMFDYTDEVLATDVRTVTAQVRDIDGKEVAGYFMCLVGITLTPVPEVSASSPWTVAFTSGKVIDIPVLSKWWLVVTDENGRIVFDITADPGPQTLYLHGIVQGAVFSTDVVTWQ